MSVVDNINHRAIQKNLSEDKEEILFTFVKDCKQVTRSDASLKLRENTKLS